MVKMNCCVISNAFGDWVSGVNTVVSLYAEELQRRGWNITILSRTRTKKSGWLNVKGLNVFYVPTTVKRKSWSNIPYQAWAYYRKINDTVKAFKDLELDADVVWVHYGTPDALWVADKTFPTKRKIFHIHGVWTRDFLEQFKKEFIFAFVGSLASLPLRYMEKRFLKKGDAIIVYSDWIKKLVSARVKDKPIHVVCNPVDQNLFNLQVKPYPRKKLGLGKNEKVVVYVGKFTPLKGIEYLLEAARMLPNCKFLLVGQTIAMPEGYYEKRAPDNVIFHEKVPHSMVASFIKTGDCYVQPTLRDGLEIPIAEALAVGKPVVTTSHEERVGIYEDAVYYAKPADPESLASAILDALRNGPKPCEKVLAKFDIKRNVDALEKVLFIE